MPEVSLMYTAILLLSRMPIRLYAEELGRLAAGSACPRPPTCARLGPPLLWFRALRVRARGAVLMPSVCM